MKSDNNLRKPADRESCGCAMGRETHSAIACDEAAG